MQATKLQCGTPLKGPRVGTIGESPHRLASQAVPAACLGEGKDMRATTL